VTMHSDGGDVRDIARALRRRKLPLLGVPLVFMAIAYVVAQVQDPVYSASVVVAVDPPAPPADAAPQPQLEGDRLVRGQRDFVESDAVRAEVTWRMGPHERISTSSTEGRDTLTITAEDGDADRAAAVANTYAASYLDLRRTNEAAGLARAIGSLDRRIAEIDAALAQLPDAPAGTPDPAAQRRNDLLGQRATAEGSRYELRLRADVAAVDRPGLIVDAAEPAASPSRPVTSRYLIVALLTGLIAGIVVALVRDSLDRSVRLAGGELVDVEGLPVLAIVPHGRGLLRRFTRRSSRRAVTEAFRSLRATLSNTPTDERVRLVQFVAPRSGHFAAVAVANVGDVFERAGHRVLLVSADLRAPSLPGLLGIDTAPGLVDVLLEDVPLADAVRGVRGRENLLALPPGAVDAGSPDLLASQKLPVLAEQLRSHAEVVFIETPPVLAAADALELAAVVDGTVVVVASGETTTDDVQHALQALARVGSNVIGCVVYQTRRA
jgi:Mrp family chromosome partitioning ATPase/capsular polysaccharide biosynthesis protein